MKKFVGSMLVLMFVSSGIVGCSAEVDVDDDRDGYYKQTTVREPDGDRTVKTEIRRD